MWALANRASDLLFGTWFDLMSGWPDWLQIFLTALPLTVIALLIYRWVSDQAGIMRAKDRIKAYLLELWLYKDDPRVLLAAQGRVVGYSLLYLRHALLPVAILLVPVGLLTAQVESRFALRAPAAGEPVLVAVTIAGAENLLRQEASLSGAGLRVETPPLRSTGTGEVLWRVSGSEPGRRALAVQVGAARDALDLAVGLPGHPPLAAETWPADDWRSLAHPSTPALPARGTAPGIARLAIDYPPARPRFAGLSSASWWLLGATLLTGFTIRRWFGVTF